MFCDNCGVHCDGGTKFCNNCGATLAAPPPGHNQPPPPTHSPGPMHHGQPMPPGPPTHYGPPGAHINIGPGSFADRLHSFGRSGTFLLGAILFAISSVLGFFVNINVIGFIQLGLISLPIIGLLIVYSASSSPRLPEKTFTGLTLIKVHTIIELVLLCIVAAIVLIAFIIMGIAGAILEPGLAVVVFIIGIIVAGIFTLFIILYYVSILRIISGIRHNLMSNTFRPLRGVAPLMVIMIIMGVFAVIGSLSALAITDFSSTFLDELFWELQLTWDQQNWVRSLVQPASVGVRMFSLLLVIAGYAGALMCIIVLRSFNNSLKYGGGYPGGQPPHMPPTQPPMQW